MGVVHRGQLCGIVLLSLVDGAVEGIADLHTYDDGGVLAMGSHIGAVFGQQILLDIVECERDAVHVKQIIEVAEVVSSLVETLCSHKVVVGIEASFA